MPAPVLFIGDKRLSSWSMRPWLALKHGGIAFEERMIRLDVETTRAEIDAASPGGAVPVLHDGDLVIWDSLAICEWAAEQDAAQAAALWPSDPADRARARAASAWMHAGAPDLRAECPMDLQRAPAHKHLSRHALKDVADLERLWAAMKNAAKTGEGPYLFGAWSIADAMFTPVATRIRDYQITVDESARAYCDALLADEHFQSWEAAARLES